MHKAKKMDNVNDRIVTRTEMFINSSYSKKEQQLYILLLNIVSDCPTNLYTSYLWLMPALK